MKKRKVSDQEAGLIGMREKIEIDQQLRSIPKPVYKSEIMNTNTDNTTMLHTQGKIKLTLRETGSAKWFTGVPQSDEQVEDNDMFEMTSHEFDYDGKGLKIDKEAQANAERIVTLWNAMDGLTNEEVILAAEMYRAYKTESEQQM